MKDERLMTIDEVAKLTSLSVGTLYHWIGEGRIPFVRFSSRCVRFRRSEILDWIEQKSHKEPKT